VSCAPVLPVRVLLLIVALIFVAVFGYATLRVAIINGPDLLTGVSALVLLLVGVGVVGALLHPPPE